MLKVCTKNCVSLFLHLNTQITILLIYSLTQNVYTELLYLCQTQNVHAETSCTSLFLNSKYTLELLVSGYS